MLVFLFLWFGQSSCFSFLASAAWLWRVNILFYSRPPAVEDCSGSRVRRSTAGAAVRKMAGCSRLLAGQILASSDEATVNWGALLKT